MSEIILKRAKLFCLQNPGVALITGGPEARGENGSLQQFYMVEIEGPLVRNDTLDCVLASVANRVVCLLETEQGVSVFDKLLEVTVYFRNLKQIVHVVCQLGLKLYLRRPAQRKWIHENRFSTAFDAIGGWKSGVWLVCLLQTKGKRVDHCILVDAKNSIIFDSAENFAIRLCGRSLRECAGSNCEMLQVAEVFGLYVLALSK